MDKTKTLEEKRKKANKDLIRRMKAGETSQLIPSHMTWFPPRPIIGKNKKDMARAYNLEEGEKCEPTKEESPS